MSSMNQIFSRQIWNYTDSFCFAHSLLRNRRKRSAYALRTHRSVTAVESNVVFISKKKRRIRLIYKIFWKINPWQKYFQKKLIIIRRNFREFAGRFSPISSFNLESFLTVERFSFEIIVSFLFSYFLTVGPENGDENILR